MKLKSLVSFVLLGGILLLITVGCAVLPTSSTSSTQSSTSSTSSTQSSTSSQSSLVATPTFSPPGGAYTNNQNVTISCATPGAEIHYTLDGTTPTSSSALFTTNLVISKSTTIKAIAVKSGMADSQVATANYTIMVATPTFSPPGGAYTNNQSVTISCATPGAEIRYTLDGTTPTSSSALFTTNLVISNSTTIKAIAVKSGIADSQIATANYTIMVATPTFSPPAGVYSNAQSVSISCATPGAGIHYTLDGTTPTPSSSLFTTNLYVSPNNSTTIKAIAVKSGMADSQVATATYTMTVATPTFSPPAGVYSNAQSVSISCATPGAGIHYTLDGTTPTPSSSLFTTNLYVSPNKSTTIKAIAVKSGMADSHVATATYTMTVATPTFSPSGGTYISNQSVSISCATPGAEIHYTLDGTTPTPSSPLFTANISVFSSNTIIKAIAIKSGMSNSQVATVTYSLTYPFLKWTESSSEVTITGAVGNPSSLVIPSTINGKPVTSIGDYAFTNCTGLTSITLPNSLTSIGNWAFKGCTGLTSITLPNSLTSIGNSAFKGCTGLTSITLPNSITSIGGGAFQYCTGLTSITLPNSLTSIGQYAFYYCTGLTYITLPNSLTSIGDVAFEDCTGLTNITLPNSLTSIGDSAFKGCSGLTSITLPNSLTSIEGEAFKGCTGLTSITLPNSLTSIGDWAFQNCTGLTSITLPNSITSIGVWAFEGCTNLTSVTVQATNPPSLGLWAFDGNATGRKIYVPSGSVSDYQAQWSEYSSAIVGY